MSYHPVRSIAEAVERIEIEITNPQLDYVDGILFSQRHGVVMTGCLTDDLPAAAHV